MHRTYIKKLLSPQVDYADINDCILIFRTLQCMAEPAKLRIEAATRMSDFNLLMISYLMLFKQKKNNLIIEIVLPFNNDRNEGDLIYKMGQYLTYAYLMTGKEVFDLYISGYTEKFALFENASISNVEEMGEKKEDDVRIIFRPSRFVLSDSFMLLLLITENNIPLFNLLFTDNLVTAHRHNWHTEGIPIQLMEDQNATYQYFNRKISAKAEPGSTLSCIKLLGQLAFLKALLSLDVLNYYLAEQLFTNLEIESLNIRTPKLKFKEGVDQYVAPIDFFRKIRFVFDELLHKPLIYHFIFAQLVSSELLKTTSGLNTVDAIENITGLWQFTKDLAYGIKEMASNILQHSSYREGVISARMISDISRDKLSGSVDIMSTVQKQLVDNVMEVEGAYPDGLLDIHIVDLGTKGILPSMLLSSQKMLDEMPKGSTLYELIQADVETLRLPETTMADVLLPLGKPMLNQQTKRTIAHFGFLIFNKLIRRNHGLIMISSPDHNGIQQTIMDPELGTIDEKESVIAGTSISVLLPVSPGWKYTPHIPHSIELPLDSQVEDMKGMEEIFNVSIYDPKEQAIRFRKDETVVIPILIPPDTLVHRSDEWDCFQFIHRKVQSFQSDHDDCRRLVLNIDLEGSSISISQLYRLLGAIEVEYPQATSIFSNLTFESFLQLQELNDSFLEYSKAALPFWSHENITLIYHYVILENGERFYFTDGLWGDSKESWVHLNTLIHRNHFNATTIFYQKEVKINHESIKKFNSLANNLAFYNRNVLLPFDLLLKGGGEYTIFEHNALVLLNNPIKRTQISDDAESMQNLINGLPGYKIADSHFKIGTKIHISDFYYAKRFFQNSFFASRFAYLIADDLDKLSEEEKKQIRSKGLTLVGYGIYSELLLSICERFVKRKLQIPEAIVDHNVLLDTGKNLEFAKYPALRETVLIIVPVASTFSTSLKMEAILGKKVLPRHYNLIHVSPYTDNSEPSRLEKEFGWLRKDADSKTITVNAFYEQNSAARVQRYFIRLRSEWEPIEKCRFCYRPDEGGIVEWREKPLMETDQTAVTPALIFDYPKANSPKIKIKQDPFELLPEMVQYGHHLRDQNHFLYLVDTEAFLTKNYDAVNKWLIRLKRTDEFSTEFSGYQNIVLLSSSHYSNAEFINLVNDVLFSSAANVIHYDPVNDYIQNFDMIYGLELSMADKIIFVDDSIKSGKTFAKINEFARYTLQIRKEMKQSPKQKTKIDACIFLINKSHPYAQMSISSNIGSWDAIYAFANLNLYTSLSHDESSPLHLESEKYQRLSEAALLDSVQAHFKKQKDKLESGAPADRNVLNLERHLKMLEVTHRLYKYFGNSNGRYSLENFDAFAEDVLHETVFLSDFEIRCRDKEGMDMFQTCLLKVLTQSPFIQFEPVKRAVFGWVEELLEDKAIEVSDAIDANILTYDLFNDFKFLLRRSVLLNSNKILDSSILQVVSKLYCPNALPLRFSQASHELSLLDGTSNPILDKKKVSRKRQQSDRQLDTDRLEKALRVQLKQLEVANIDRFDVFFTAQVKELLLLNEARAPRLEMNLRSLIQTPYLFKHLAIMLQVENATVVHSFFHFLIEQTDIKERLSRFSGEMLERKFINRLFRRRQVLNHQKYKILRSYYRKTGQPKPVKNPYLISYLKIRFYVMMHEKSSVKLSDKTKIIFDELMLMCLPLDSNVSVQSLGSFLVVKDNFGIPVPVYDRNGNNDAALHQYNLENPADQLLQDFLDLPGKRPMRYPHSVIELTRDFQTGEWLDEHSIEGQDKYVRLSKSFLRKEINRVILLKLTNHNAGQSVSNGMVGFYFITSTKSASDNLRVQYLTLLRSTINLFVEKNHHSPHFREWLLSENQKRFLMLTGHSKEMMQTVINHEKSLKDVAHDFEHVQSLIMLNDNMPKVGGVSNLAFRLTSFYNTDNKVEINESFFGLFRSSVRKIFRSSHIENRVAVDVHIDSRSTSQFSFLANKRILNIIVFELILNAKKNRWHFLPDDKTLFKADNLQNSKNQVWLYVGVEDSDKEKMVTLRVTNTCCNMNHRQGDKEDPVSLLKSTKNIKSEYVTSGTALINVLVEQVLNGTVSFDCVPLEGDPELYLFFAEIKFNGEIYG